MGKTVEDFDLTYTALSFEVGLANLRHAMFYRRETKLWVAKCRFATHRFAISGQVKPLLCEVSSNRRRVDLALIRGNGTHDHKDQINETHDWG